jgi:transposase
VLSPADQPDVFAYDLIDLPPIKPVTTRINLHKGNCPCCGKRVAAQPPADMAPGTPFGPGVVSLVSGESLEGLSRLALLKPTSHESHNG